MRRLIAPFLAAFLLAVGIGCLAKAQVGQTLWTPVLQSGFVPAPAFYVATAAGGGSDSNAGTLASPFLTLGKCQTAMQGSSGAKLTCYIRAGTYHPTGQTTCAGNILDFTSSDNGETWSYYPPDGVDTAIIDGNASSSSTGYENMFQWDNATNITVNGLQFQHSCQAAIWINGYSGGNSNGAIIKNNLIHDGYDIGVVIEGAAQNGTIANNEIYNFVASAIQAISYSGSPQGLLTGLVVSNNFTLNTCTNGIDCGAIYLNDVALSGATGEIVEVNYAVNCGASGSGKGKCYYLDDSQSNATVTGNVCTGTFFACFEINGGTNNSLTKNIGDLESVGSIDVYNAPGSGTNTYSSNILVAGSNSTQNGWGGTGSGTKVIEHNQYYAYGTPAIVTTGNPGDASPTTANPNFTCSWKYSGATTVPSGFAYPAAWGTWGPLGFTLPENWTPTPSPGSGTC
jgi:hypothetical protein